MVKKTKITYYGWSLFLIEASNGIKIGIDPYNRLFKSVSSEIEADIVLVTHRHPDHSNVSLFKGKPYIVKTIGKQSFKGVEIEGFPSSHGSRTFFRLKNIIFKFKLDNMVFCHLGDLGSIPDNRILEELKDIDILFIPIGGKFTLNYSGAYQLIKIINPSIAVPMHYREQSSKIIILDKIDNFLSIFNDFKLFRSTVSLQRGLLPGETEIWVLKS